MEVAYRISKTKYSGSHDEMFSGAGAAINAGRWNSKGNPMVYASDSRALATLEIAVHLKNEDKLEAYSVCEIPDGLCEVVDPADLPAGWDELVVNPLAAQSWGDIWIDFGATPTVKIPSVLMPAEWNYLINPEHGDFDKLELGPIYPHPFDRRIKSNSLV